MGSLELCETTLSQGLLEQVWRKQCVNFLKGNIGNIVAYRPLKGAIGALYIPYKAPKGLYISPYKVPIYSYNRPLKGPYVAFKGNIGNIQEPYRALEGLVRPLVPL